MQAEVGFFYAYNLYEASSKYLVSSQSPVVSSQQAAGSLPLTLALTLALTLTCTRPALTKCPPPRGACSAVPPPAA
eukprot:scaffold77434_cov48-Phaeocystis_antarctica.AAC.2